MAAPKSERRRKLQAEKKRAKAARMAAPGGQSRYAAKQRIPIADRLEQRRVQRAVERAPGTYLKRRHGDGCHHPFRCERCDGTCIEPGRNEIRQACSACGGTGRVLR